MQEVCLEAAGELRNQHRNVVVTEFRPCQSPQSLPVTDGGSTPQLTSPTCSQQPPAPAPAPAPPLMTPSKPTRRTSTSPPSNPNRSFSNPTPSPHPSNHGPDTSPIKISSHSSNPSMMLTFPSKFFTTLATSTLVFSIITKPTTPSSTSSVVLGPLIK